MYKAFLKSDDKLSGFYVHLLKKKTQETLIKLVGVAYGLCAVVLLAG